MTAAAAEHHGYQDLAKAPRFYSWADRDGEAIAHAAHRLKGGARSVGAVALGDACEAVEKDAGASAALWPAVEEEAARAAAGARMLMAAMA